jgi:hypothetical protein
LPRLQVDDAARSIASGVPEKTGVFGAIGGTFVTESAGRKTEL